MQVQISSDEVSAVLKLKSSRIGRTTDHWYDTGRLAIPVVPVLSISIGTSVVACPGHCLHSAPIRLCYEADYQRLCRMKMTGKNIYYAANQPRRRTEGVRSAIALTPWPRCILYVYTGKK